MFGWLLTHLSGGYARHHPLRAIVQVIAIAIGVALGYAINLINASALDEFSGAVRHVLGQADFTVSGGRLGFDERLYARIASLPEVDTASPIVEVEAPVPSMPRSSAGLATLRVVGVDIFRAAPLSPALVGESEGSDTGPFALLGDGLFLSPAALERFKVRPGDTLALQVGPKVVTFTDRGSPAARPRRGGTCRAGHRRRADAPGPGRAPASHRHQAGRQCQPGHGARDDHARCCRPA